MLVDHMLCTIDGARTIELAQLGSDISRAYANGALGEDDYQRLWEAIQERRQKARAAHTPRASPRPRRAIPRSPDRQRSLRRRRRLSAAGKMPPGLAEQFTVGERAVLYVVAQEVELHGQCDLYIDQIAAFAGVGRSTTRNALREAKRLDLIRVDERRLSARYNDANRITIISWEWRAWLAHGRKETVKNPKPTHQPEYSSRLVERYVSVAQARKGHSRGCLG
jgi:hypothetical protein